MKHSLKICQTENNPNVPSPTCVETTFAFLRLRLQLNPPSTPPRVEGESESEKEKEQEKETGRGDGGWMIKFAMHLTALKFSRNI